MKILLLTGWRLPLQASCSPELLIDQVVSLMCCMAPSCVLGPTFEGLSVGQRHKSVISSGEPEACEEADCRHEHDKALLSPRFKAASRLLLEVRNHLHIGLCDAVLSVQ